MLFLHIVFVITLVDLERDSDSELKEIEVDKKTIYWIPTMFFVEFSSKLDNERGEWKKIQ